MGDRSRKERHQDKSRRQSSAAKRDRMRKGNGSNTYSFSDICGTMFHHEGHPASSERKQPTRSRSSRKGR